ncbi:Malate-2H(+)/Na(+)-lactate antiporter [invertebrate metagenome]|uniref:Malate-2H(+)/Na(+)-lactate antiporter n=1 Tax=invertebrate metagenome TaxID=1711999 RepID=A0A2H9T8M2_9ZZZZ
MVDILSKSRSLFLFLLAEIIEPSEEFMDPMFSSRVSVQGTRAPRFVESAFLLAIITLSLVTGIMAFNLDVHMLLISALVLTMVLSGRCGYNLNQQIEVMGESIKNATGALFAFFLIGMIIGSWILSGTLPALIYYGLNVVSPQLFLPTGFLLCCVVTFATGTAWGTASTVGLALTGMGMGLGVPLPVIAGMIVSGGIFGVKMSPISDLTILSSATVGADPKAHLKAVNKVNIPVLLISIAAYYFIGCHFSASQEGGTDRIALIQSTLSQTFDLNLLVLSPIIITLGLTFTRMPSQLAMFLGVLMAGIMAVIFQHSNLSDVFSALNYGYQQSSGVELVDSLLVRGGIQSMMWTFSLTIIALCLGGLLERIGFLGVLLKHLLVRVKSDFALIFTTLMSCLLGNAATSEVYLSVILNGSLYKNTYKEREFKPEMLSRLLEEGSLPTGFLLPWTTAGAFMTATLGVSPLDYAPYAFYVWLTPLVSLLLVSMGRTLIKYHEGEAFPKTQQAS